MRWKKKTYKLEDIGSTRRKKRFAFWPTRLTNREYVWLERYVTIERLCHFDLATIEEFLSYENISNFDELSKLTRDEYEEQLKWYLIEKC